MSVDPPAPNPEWFRFYITDIEFQPSITDPNCKISVKLFVDDELIYSLPWIDHTQPFRWSRLIACDVSPFSKVTLKLCKIVNHKQRSFIFPSYEVSEVNEGNGETNLEHPELIWTVTIRSLTPAMAERSFPEELIRFGRIEGAYDDHRPNETVKFLFKGSLQFASIVAETLPEATTAKITFLILMKAWELLEQKAQSDGTIGEILRGLNSIQGVVGVLSQTSNSILPSTMDRSKEPISGILRLLDDISIHVFNRLVAYNSDKAYLDDTFNIPEYLARLEKLQSGFHASWPTLTAPCMDSTNGIYDELPTWQEVSAPSDNPFGKMEDPYEMLNLLGPMNIVAGYDPDRACMRGTRQAILNKIITWTQNRDNAEAFMWISGQAGMGKTAIATSLCQRLDTMQALAGSFFFQDDDPDRNNSVTLINNLIHDMAVQCPAYAHEAANAIRTNRKLCKAHLSLRYEGLVQKPLERLKSLSTPTTLVLVIDALDECGDRDSRTRVLQKLYDMSKLVPWLKVIITARPVGDIQECFQNYFLHKTIVHLHDFDASCDIRAYIEDQLGVLAQTESWPHDNISKLCAMAQGVFLWATATTKYISSSTIPASARIQRIFDNRKSPVVDYFDALYARALDKAICGNDDETKDAYIRCIGAILATSELEPLPVPELQYLLLAAGRIDQLTVGRVIRNLGPLLLILDGHARFHHSSFKDYITNASRSGDFFIDLDQYEAEPATCCLRRSTTGANELAIGYIDDVTILVWGDTFEDTHAGLVDIMTREGGALEWSTSHNSTFELDKTACVDFSRRREPIPGSPGKTRPLTRQNLIWGDHVVRTVSQHVFLGVLIDQELRWTAQSHRALAKGMAWASQLGRLARTNFGASPAIARKLYVSIAVPRFTYAVDVWYRPVTLREGERGSGSIGFAHRLTRVQRTAALSILGGLRSTPSASLDAHSRLLPVHLLLNQVCERAALRLASVPTSHPLHAAVRQSSRGRKAHRTPLHDILALLALPPSLVSPRQPLNPLVTPPKREFPSKQEAKRAAETDNTRFRFFTDGSHSQDGVGAAAVLLGRGTPSTTAGLNLGCSCCYSVLDAELTAISLAIHLAHSTGFWDDMVIYSDSQTAVRLVDPTHGTPSHALAVRVRAELRALRRAKPLLDIRLAWCPGHQGLRGNDLANQEARAAAGGKDFGNAVPDSFQRLLPIPLDPEHLRKSMDYRYQERSADYWRQSEAGAKHMARLGRVVASEFMNLIADLPRRKAVLLYRLITGHVPLQRHLWVIGCADDPTCRYCGTAPETVSHFLLQCPAHAEARHYFLGPLGRDARVLDVLFSTQKFLPLLISFVFATGRFS